MGKKGVTPPQLRANAERVRKGLPPKAKADKKK